MPHRASASPAPLSDSRTGVIRSACGAHNRHPVLPVLASAKRVSREGLTGPLHPCRRLPVAATGATPACHRGCLPALPSPPFVSIKEHFGHPLCLSTATSWLQGRAAYWATRANVPVCRAGRGGVRLRMRAVAAAPWQFFKRLAGVLSASGRVIRGKPGVCVLRGCPGWRRQGTDVHSATRVGNELARRRMRSARSQAP